MALSTIEQAYALARSGQVPNFESLKHRLKADGCRAVDALLAPRTISAHLTAICAATFQPPTESSPVSEPDGGGVTPE